MRVSKVCVSLHQQTATDMTQEITSAVNNTLAIAKVKGTVIVTPSTIIIEDIKDFASAKKIEAAFVKGGLKSLGVDDMEELEMGDGFSLTIAY